ncbi:MAG TPA: choice-of-anchor D domain-containing protein, partial [Candidatus Latescibacteria bacterium]|nr:choice-of-anchor D domain-containing protein [Candidatus Latescibacterota bacterium]
TSEDLERECANAIAVLEGLFPQFAGQLTCAEGSIVITFPEIVEDPEEPSLIEQIEDELADPDSPIATLAPVLDLGSLKGGDLDFGDVARDESIAENFAFSNSSDDPEAVLVVSVSVDGDGYSLSTGTLSVAPGESGSFDVNFSAADVANANGSYPGSMTIRTNDPENQQTVIALAAVITTGLDPAAFDLSAAAIEFGEQTLNVGATESFTISNAGGFDLDVTLELAGDDVFAISSTAETLGEGESADIEVVFTPGESIDYSATITIATNDADNPSATVTISGTGAAPVVPGECRTALHADGKTLVGFLDDNDVIDLFDFFKFADAFGKEAGESGHDPCADFDGNGDINLFDFFKFADSFGREPVEFL